MKKNLLIACALFMLLSSTFAQRKKIAVVTFYTDKHIDYSDIPNSNVTFVASMKSLYEDPKFNLKPVLDNFHKAFFAELAKDFPFDFIPEEQVINNEAYKAYESKWGETKDAEKSKFAQQYISVDGYKPLIINPLGKKENRNETKMLEIFGKDVDGVMIVTLDYRFLVKAAVMGMGSAGMYAYARIKLWNKEGDKVFTVNERASSDQTVALISGIPVTNVDEILPMCESASKKLLEDLRKRMPKITEKAAKKL
ncbi:MAG: hypothetical protein J0M08_05750 [Bacteroidetes bacterium]|nr:hypothetical protein [Bacteroidota bacterium]